MSERLGAAVAKSTGMIHAECQHIRARARGTSATVWGPVVGGRGAAANPFDLPMISGGGQHPVTTPARDGLGFPSISKEEVNLQRGPLKPSATNDEN